MSLLKEILEVVIYKMLGVENVMATALAMLANELACQTNELI